MDRWVPPRTGVHSHLAEPFPLVPDSYVSPWSGGEGGPTLPFPGTMAVVWGGCTQYTLLVVTGSGRGRLVEVVAGSDVVPHFHTDADFLAWYERWLDFTLAGHRDLTWFSHQMAGDEQELGTRLSTAHSQRDATLPRTRSSPIPGQAHRFSTSWRRRCRRNHTRSYEKRSCLRCRRRVSRAVISCPQR